MAKGKAVKSSAQVEEDESLFPFLTYSPRLERWLRIICLFLSCLISIAIRIFSIVKHESIIHEYDPYFNFRATQYVLEHGLADFRNWFDSRSWYPLGRVVGGTVYPGLMLTASALYKAAHWILLPFSIKDVCVMTAPVFSAFTVLLIYKFGEEIDSKATGLIAGAIVAVIPGLISRTAAGSFDNEGIAIFALVLTFLAFLKAVRYGSIKWSVVSAFAYAYMVLSWGGYVFITNLIPIYVITLSLSGRYSRRLYVAYSTMFTLGSLMAMLVPFVSFNHMQTGEHLAAWLTLAGLQLWELFRFMKASVPDPKLLALLLKYAFANTLGLASFALILGMATGKISPWTGRFYALLDPTYAAKYMPLIASVAEHQPSTWGSFYFDLQFLLFVMPAGIYFIFKDINEGKIFVLLYAMVSLYFASVMVRLVLVAAPAVVLVSSIAVSKLLMRYSKLMHKDTRSKQRTKHSSHSPLPAQKELALTICLLGLVVLSGFVRQSTWISKTSYSSSSLILSAKNQDNSDHVFDDFREAYNWLRQNTDSDAKVMAWWDYGYQIASMGNRTVIVDNNTWNNTHIATVGLAMASEEEDAHKIALSLDVDYILVVFGGQAGYSSDDISKFLWMVRIASAEYPDLINEKDYLNSKGEYRIDSEAPPAMFNSLVYKLSYYSFNHLVVSSELPTGYDRVRTAEVGTKNITLTHFEEAITTSNWMVRIYKVKKPHNRNSNNRS